MTLDYHLSYNSLNELLRKIMRLLVCEYKFSQSLLFLVLTDGGYLQNNELLLIFIRLARMQRPWLSGYVARHIFASYCV